MERYGGVSTTEQPEPDPPLNWPSPALKTGLEEPIWQLGLGEDSYPERDDRADCTFYLRTGFCRFGQQCRFNHPRDRNLALGGGGRPGGVLPERDGQPVCKFYMRTGRCNFGASCKYHHPRDGSMPVDPVPLNYFGFPLRPGERECSYYVRTGECKFGVTCKFHHPQPAPPPPLSPFHSPLPSTALYQPLQLPSSPSPQQYGVASSWQVARPSVVSGSYVQSPYGHYLIPPGMVPISGWSHFPAQLSPPVVPSSTQHSASYGITQLSPTAPSFQVPYATLSSSIDESKSPVMFPERPGKPDCQYYMKTGDCKFGSSCRYHHPPDWHTAKTDCSFSPKGLPIRPGEAICAYYREHGICKFGQTCKFDHPMGSLSCSSSASSLSDMTVVPFPIGSSSSSTTAMAGSVFSKSAPSSSS